MLDRLQRETAPRSLWVREVLAGEDRPHLAGADLAALVVGDGLDDLRELDLQSPREFELVLGSHDVRDTALARLRVHPDDRLVGAADILGIDREVGDCPVIVIDTHPGCRGIGLHDREALVDGVLMGAGERRVDEVAAVRMTFVHRDLVAVLDRSPHFIDVAEIDLRIDALAVEVHAEGDEADVAGALAVAEQAALDAIGTGHVAEFGCGNSGSAVVVGMQRDDERIAPGEVAGHPLNGVGVDVRGRHFDGGRQVDDDLAIGGWLPDIGHGIAHLDGEFEFGAGVGLGGVLEEHIGLVGDLLGELRAQLRTMDRNIHDAGTIEAEHHSPLQGRG
ncbi:unannotated protein [freshwater metagenome]|uniref:Unannotated protein n=1 Tax=freshwater metagenome TaxID=449393 RepID=A0A6J7HVM6_9ZZZZ